MNGCDLTAEALARAEDRRAVRLRGAAEDDRHARRDSLPTNQTVALDVELTQRAEDKLADAKRPFKVRLDVRATKDTRETARETIKINP